MEGFTDFFDSIVNFFEVIWNLITSVLNSAMLFFQTLMDVLTIPQVLSSGVLLPSIITVSVSIVMVVGVGKLLLSILQVMFYDAGFSIFQKWNCVCF